MITDASCPGQSLPDVLNASWKEILNDNGHQRQVLYSCGQSPPNMLNVSAKDYEDNGINA
jgi:hypothetical protein